MFDFILFIFHVVKTTKSVNLNLNQNWIRRKNDFFKFLFFIFDLNIKLFPKIPEWFRTVIKERGFTETLSFAWW